MPDPFFLAGNTAMFSKRILENLLARSRMRNEPGNIRSNWETSDDELQILELENRILYDAAPIDIEAHASPDHAVEPGDFSALMDLASQLSADQTTGEGDSWWLNENLSDEQSSLLDKYVAITSPFESNDNSVADATDIAKRWESLERLFDELNDETGSDGDPVSDSEEQAYADDSDSFLIEPSEHGSTRQAHAVSDLIVVDTSISDYEDLLEDVLAGLVNPNSVSVIYIDENSDGIVQITDALGEHDNLYAIHLLSHGSAGELRLGATSLSIDNIGSYSEQFASWQSSLAIEADLLIYGCDVASTSDGRQLLDTIGTLSGTDVAASDDLTGNASLGGDWDLEYRFGEIQAELIHGLSGSGQWSGTLGELSTDDGNGGAHRALAIDANGNQVTVWTDTEGDIDDDSNPSAAVYFQRLDFQGILAGGNVLVNEETDGDQKWASVASDEHGNFVVTWTSEGQNGQTSGVYARMFNSQGIALTGEFLVSGSEATEHGKNSSIAMNSDGEFIIAWEGAIDSFDSTGVFGQRFESDGTLYGGIFQINSTTAGTQAEAVVTINDQDEAVFAWSNSISVFAQRMDFDTGLVGSEITVVSGFSLIHYDDPSVDINASGDFLVSYTYHGQITNDHNVIVSAFNDDGSENGFPILANMQTSGDQYNSQISYADDGTFVVVWEGSGPSDIDGIFKRDFDETLAAVDDGQRVNAQATGNQSFPSIDRFPDGSYGIVYTEQDGTNYSILGSNFNSGPTNQAPQSNNATVSLVSDTPYAFSLSDFEYNDYESDIFDFVKITELPNKGTLILNGTVVTEDQEISVDDITNGLLVYQNDPGESGTGYTNFEFKVKDSNRYSLDEYEMTVDVTAAPLLDATDAISIDENDSFVKQLVANNPQGPVTFTINGGDDAALFALNTSTGVLTFIGAPDYENPNDANENNVYEVIVEANDGSTNTLQTVSVTVDPVNDNSPVFSTTNSVRIDENATSVLTVNATDDDEPTETITYSITGGDDEAKFSIDATSGELVFVSAADFENPTDNGNNNTYEVTVTAGDNNGNSTDQTIIVTVDPVNESSPAFSTINSVSVDENETTVLTVNATDDDEPTEVITYSITGGDDEAKFSIDSSSGELVFVSAPDFENPTDNGNKNTYEVTVTASDNNGNSTNQTIVVTVDPINDNSPVFSTANSVRIDENTTSVLTVNATDDDEPTETVSYSITGGADQTKFSIDSTSGELVFVSAPDFENPTDTGNNNTYEVTVTASDNNGNSTDQTIVVTVDPINEFSPSFTSSDSFNISENSIAVTTIEADDDDTPAETVTFSIIGGADASKFTIDATSGELRFVSAPDFELPTDDDGNNIYEVTVAASDNNGNSTDQTIQITVESVDEAEPVFISPNSIRIDENVADVMTVQATDADGDPGNQISYSVTGGDDGSKFEIDSVSGELTFKQSPDFENPTDFDSDNEYQVTVTAVDSSGNSSDHTITVTIDPVNETAPAFTTTGAINVVENTTSVTTVNATDDDLPSESISYSITGGDDAAMFSIDANSGQLSFKNARDYEKAGDSDKNNLYDVTVTADDNNGNMTSQEITVTVTNEEEDPDIRDKTMSVDENSVNGTLVGQVRLGDHDDQSHTFTITGGDPDNAFAIDDTGHLTISDSSQIDFEQQQTWTLDVTVEDEFSNFDTATITINLNDLDETPEVSNQGWSLDENSAIGTFVGTVNVDNFDAGDSVTFSWTQTDGTFFLDETTGDIFVANSSNLDFELVQSIDIEVRAIDIGGNTDSATLTFTINDENETPIVADDNFSVDSGGRLVVRQGQILVNDVDPEHQNLQVELVNDVQNGRLILRADGRFVFVPNEGFVGTDSFTYQVTDGENISETATVEIEVFGLPGNDTNSTGSENEEVDGSSSGVSGGDSAGSNEGLISPNSSSGNGSNEDDIETLLESGTGQFAPAHSVANSQLISIDLTEQSADTNGSIDITYGSFSVIDQADLNSSEVKQSALQTVDSIGSFVTSDILFLAGNNDLWEELGALSDEVVSDPMFSKVAITGVAGFTGAVTVTYVLWMVRGGYLMASVLSSLPAWRFVDPLPMLDVLEGTGGEDGESIESIIRDANSVSATS